MGKGKKSKKNRKRGAEQAGRVAKLPKKKCCESKSRCNRCPLRMLREGTLPDGLTVHKRKLVTVEKAATIRAAKQAKKVRRAA